MPLSVGDKAPNFHLYDTDKKEVSLSDYAGQVVVLLFFPQAFTGTCTAELCTVRDNISDYQNLDVAVLAISVDSLFTLAEFKKQQNYSFPMLSDFNKEVSKEYGALYDEFVFGMKGVSRRAAFVVGREGTLQYAEVLESAGDLPDFEAIKEAIEKAKATNSTR